MNTSVSISLSRSESIAITQEFHSLFFLEHFLRLFFSLIKKELNSAKVRATIQVLRKYVCETLTLIYFQIVTELILQAIQQNKFSHWIWQWIKCGKISLKQDHYYFECYLYCSCTERMTEIIWVERSSISYFSQSNKKNTTEINIDSVGKTERTSASKNRSARSPNINKKKRVTFILENSLFNSFEQFVSVARFFHMPKLLLVKTKGK